VRVKYHRITTSADVSLVHSSSSTTVGAVERPTVIFVLKKSKIKSKKMRAKFCVASNKLQTNHFFLAAVEGTRRQWNADFTIYAYVRRVKNKKQSIRNKLITNTATSRVKTIAVYRIRLLLYCWLLKKKMKFW